MEGVHGIHDVIIHKYGDMKLISFHIEVNAGSPVMDLHDLSERVEDAVEEEGTGGKAIAHVDPVDLAHPAYERVKSVLESVLMGDPRIVTSHDLRVTGPCESLAVAMDVVVRVDVPASVYEEIRAGVEAALRSRIDNGKLERCWSSRRRGTDGAAESV